MDTRTERTVPLLSPHSALGGSATKLLLRTEDRSVAEIAGRFSAGRSESLKVFDALEAGDHVRHCRPVGEATGVSPNERATWIGVPSDSHPQRIGVDLEADFAIGRPPRTATSHSRHRSRCRA